MALDKILTWQKQYQQSAKKGLILDDYKRYKIQGTTLSKRKQPIHQIARQTGVIL